MKTEIRSGGKGVSLPKPSERLPLGVPGSLLSWIARSPECPPHACGGFASCGTCLVRIVDASFELPRPDAAEEAVLARQVQLRRLSPKGLRLACQLEVPEGAHLEFQPLMATPRPTQVQLEGLRFEFGPAGSKTEEKS